MWGLVVQASWVAWVRHCLVFTRGPCFILGVSCCR